MRIAQDPSFNCGSRMRVRRCIDASQSWARSRGVAGQQLGFGDFAVVARSRAIAAMRRASLAVFNVVLGSSTPDSD
jgi:hypothetical protein